MSDPVKHHKGSNHKQISSHKSLFPGLSTHIINLPLIRFYLTHRYSPPDFPSSKTFDIIVRFDGDCLVQRKPKIWYTISRNVTAVYSASNLYRQSKNAPELLSKLAYGVDLDDSWVCGSAFSPQAHVYHL